MKPAAPKPRSIPVRKGDVFRHGLRHIVVTALDDRCAVCFDTLSGRMSRIKTRRLQREYERCGEVIAAAAHRKLARAEAKKGAGR